MILSFKDRDSERFHNGIRIAAFQSFATQAKQKLNSLDDAISLTDLTRKPGNRLEALMGNRQGQYSIRVNRQWRLCFRWSDEGPYDVELVDYH